MYYPVQIPYILDKGFLNNIEYREEIVNELSDFVICYWQMIPKTVEKAQINNIIITDGGIDLVANFDAKMIGFSGMSRTDFDFTIYLPNRFMGLRLLPGSFYQLTGVSPMAAMDKYLPLSDIYNDFDEELFFSLPFNDAKAYLLNTMEEKFKGLEPNIYTKLFHDLSLNPPSFVKEIYVLLNLSPSQCQRKFIKHYGITPKKVLSILRFQKCLTILTSTQSMPRDILELVQYYDQSHFINDFKQHIGMTPFEFLTKYKDD